MSRVSRQLPPHKNPKVHFLSVPLLITLFAFSRTETNLQLTRLLLQRTSLPAQPYTRRHSRHRNPRPVSIRLPSEPWPQLQRRPAHPWRLLWLLVRLPRSHILLHRCRPQCKIHCPHYPQNQPMMCLTLRRPRPRPNQASPNTSTRARLLFFFSVVSFYVSLLTTVYLFSHCVISRSRIRLIFAFSSADG
jgi:hypothetical protein